MEWISDICAIFNRLSREGHTDGEISLDAEIEEGEVEEGRRCLGGDIEEGLNEEGENDEGQIEGEDAVDDEYLPSDQLNLAKLFAGPNNFKVLSLPKPGNLIATLKHS